MGNKFYVVTIQHYVDQSQPSVTSIFAYQTKNEAYAAYFYNLSSSVSNPELKAVYCELLNGFGDISDRKFVQIVEDTDEEE